MEHPEHHEEDKPHVEPHVEPAAAEAVKDVEVEEKEVKEKPKARASTRTKAPEKVMVPAVKSSAGGGSKVTKAKAKAASPAPPAAAAAVIATAAAVPRKRAVAAAAAAAGLLPVPAILTVPGFVFGAGSNPTGELGAHPDEVQQKLRPAPVKGLEAVEIVDISCGGMHTMALTKDGKVFCKTLSLPHPPLPSLLRDLFKICFFFPFSSSHFLFLSCSFCDKCFQRSFTCSIRHPLDCKTDCCSLCFCFFWCSSIPGETMMRRPWEGLGLSTSLGQWRAWTASISFAWSAQTRLPLLCQMLARFMAVEPSG